MNSFQVRRATLEDLPRLMPLWRMEHLPAALLEKRFTEFQVVLAGDELIGAVGLQIGSQQGKLHSEVFARPELAEASRPLIWERLQTIAHSHGLSRLWTRLDAPFWRGVGFEAVEAPGSLPPEYTSRPIGLAPRRSRGRLRVARHLYNIGRCVWRRA